MEIRDYIYFEHHSLDSELCNHLIEKFEKDDHKANGLCRGGEYHPEIKRSVDLNISNTNKEEWTKECDTLQNILTPALSRYADLTRSLIFHHYIMNMDPRHNGFQIQRTAPDQGYAWHNDSCQHRLLTWIWYLNNVEEGYTEFYDGLKVKPETGKLMIFPATWQYPHRGVPPKTGLKYICTGWVYSNAVS
tara:strand:+ start:750 stop:1319 length:570 start_codon:yes stop_codon:yes gene_type:complete